MRSAAPRRSLLSTGVLAAALLLSGCVDEGSDGPERKPGVQEGPAATAAPAPAENLPSPVQELVVGTDVGQFLVTPDASTTPAEVEGAIARLKTFAGVDTVGLTPEGKVDLVFTAGVTKQQREAAVKQLAALGTVEEGV